MGTAAPWQAIPEELSLLRSMGMRRAWRYASRMTWRSSAPTALNGILVGIALAVLMLGLGGADSLNVARATHPTLPETIAW
jgi:hypothetical protein